MRSKMRPLSYKSAVASYEYNHYEGDLPIMLGTDRRGEVIMGDLARMGNLLLWGVGVELDDFLEGLLVNLTSRFSLDEVGIVMLDFAEWCTRFSRIPHVRDHLIHHFLIRLETRVIEQEIVVNLLNGHGKRIFGHSYELNDRHMFASFGH